MNQSFADIIDIFFEKEKCAVCMREFDSLLLQHPPLDQAHIEYAENRKKERDEIESKRKPWNELKDPFNRFISKECPDLEAAKLFVHRWSEGTHENSSSRQELLIDGTKEGATMRAMAYMVSRVLEGYDDSTDVILTRNYMSTRYGSELYHAM